MEATALRPDEPGRRRCLKCLAYFDSRDAGNRRCPRCADLLTRSQREPRFADRLRLSRRSRHVGGSGPWDESDM